MKHTRARGINGKALAAVTGPVSVATVLGGAGLAAASAGPRPATSGTEHFNLMTTERSASKYVVVASGVFTAAGTDISGSSSDLVRLAGGTFKISHPGAPRGR